MHLARTREKAACVLEIEVDCMIVVVAYKTNQKRVYLHVWLASMDGPKWLVVEKLPWRQLDRGKWLCESCKGDATKRGRDGDGWTSCREEVASSLSKGVHGKAIKRERQKPQANLVIWHGEGVWPQGEKG